MIARREDLVDAYWRDVQHHELPPMSREEEAATFARIRAGGQDGQDAANEVLRSNLRFVVSIARAYDTSGVPLEDRISAGNLGMYEAVQRFDPARGWKFISFAVHWIRQYIRVLCIQQTDVRRPQNAYIDAGRLTAARARLEQRIGRPPTEDEALEEAGVTPAQARLAGLAYAPEAHLEAPVAPGDGRTIGEVLGEDDPEHEADLDLDALLMALARLDDRERHIVVCYYGLDGEEPQTLEVIGQGLGITRERVWQLKRRALEVLRGDGVMGELAS